MLISIHGIMITSLLINGKKNTFFSRGPAYINHTKPESDYIPISQGKYLIQLDNSCNLLNKINIPNKNLNKVPLPGPGVSR
jgi:hypothetical protein